MEKRQDRGEEVEALENRPELLPELRYVWNGFILLSDSRSSGMGLSYIPLSEILAWFQIYDIDDMAEREEVLEMIKALDRIYVEYQNSKDKKVKTVKKDS